MDDVKALSQRKNGIEKETNSNITKTIKVSVLVYVKNDRNHIKKCIHSVINQTLKEIEILIIDGGSIDGTLEILKEMSGLDSRIKILHTEPSVGLQFNTGLKAAKGEYIGICESDDYILPNMYEVQYKMAKQNKLDILKANFNRFCGYGKESIILPFNVLGDDSLYGQILCPRDNDNMLKMGIISYWSGIYRKDFLLEHDIFMNETKGAAYQDTSFAFIALLQAERVMILKDAFYCYWWDNPKSSVNAPQKVTTLIEEYAALKKRLVKDNMFELCKEYYFSWKVGGLVWFYSRLPQSQKMEYVHLLYAELYQDLNSGEFQGNKLGLDELEIINSAKYSERCLEEYLRSSQAASLKEKQSLREISDCNIIIFGNGNMGKLIRLYIESIGGVIVAFIDNKKGTMGRKRQRNPYHIARICDYPFF